MSLILAIARRLRHKTLEALVGRTIHIGSESTAITDILAVCGDVIPKSAVPQSPAPGLPTVTKYALLDIELALPAPPTMKRLSVTELRALNFLAAKSNVVGDVRDDLDTTILEDMLEELAANEFVVKLMLNAIDAGSFAETFARTSERRPPTYWPHAFRVSDACVTNSRTLWLGMHFYL